VTLIVCGVVFGKTGGWACRLRSEDDRQAIDLYSHKQSAIVERMEPEAFVFDPPG
jgi:hypothetical protein